MKAYPKYKDPGVDWLGDIPEHWNMKRLKYVAYPYPSNVDKKSKEGQTSVKLCNYVDVYKNEFIDSKIDFMQATASEAEIDKFHLKKNDVIITKDSETPDDIAEPALVKYEENNLVCGYHLTLIRTNQKQLDGSYLFRLFKVKKWHDQFVVYASGVTRFGLGAEYIKNASVPLPPKTEQTSIITFLDRKTSKIDSLIEKKKQMIELLKQELSAIINQAVTKGINPDVEMKDSGIEWLGEIPKHWESGRTKSVFIEINDRSEEGKEELLTVSHITGVTPRSEKNVNMFLAESFADYKRCETDDLVINTMWAWMGALGVTKQDGIVSPSYNVYRSRNNRIYPLYSDYLFRTQNFIIEINRFSKGIWSSRLRLYPQEFFQILIPIPPKAEQEEIANHIMRESVRIQKIIRNAEKEISLIEEYRTALISEAVTGKIDVRQEV